MARWITKTVDGKEVLRVRQGFQFTWNGVTFPANYIENASDAELEERGFTVEEMEDPITPIKIESISRRQFFQGLAKAPYTVIGEDEALAAMAGVIPAVLLEFVKLLPESQQFDLKMLLAGAQTFARDHETTQGVAVWQQWSPEQVDEFFAFCSKR